MSVKLPYAKSELYRMAKSRKHHDELISMVVNARFADDPRERHTIHDEECMRRLRDTVDKHNAKSTPKYVLGYVDPGFYELHIINDNYPVLVHFHYSRKSTIVDIQIPLVSKEGMVLYIIDLREMLSYAEIDDISVKHHASAECVRGHSDVYI